MKKYVLFVSIVICALVLGGCGHEHAYIEATCTAPRTCEGCGETEGEALGHIFLEATCESPAICERCGETNGEALGHSTEVGTCSNCNEYQGKDIVETILDKLTYANGQADLAFTVQVSGSDYYKSFLNGISYYESAKTEYEAALDLCGNYSELATLKKDIQNLINALPLTVYGSDEASLKLYLEDLTTFVTLEAKCQLTMISVRDSIQ